MSDVQLKGKDSAETGIYLATTMHDFDPQAFGEWLGSQDSVTQAGVLTGMALGFDKIGHNGDRQIAYLVDDLRDQANDRVIGSFIESLHGFWTAE